MTESLNVWSVFDLLNFLQTFSNLDLLDEICLIVAYEVAKPIDARWHRFAQAVEDLHIKI